jgi:phosphate starvation-inducible membrane PsiE
MWLGLVHLLLRFVFSGSLELVLWYCNNSYSNSILFEVRNVVTSLLGLVIVSHLSPKGSGRFNYLTRKGQG